MQSKNLFSTRNLVKIALLSSIGFLLTFLKLPPLPFFPFFLDLELSDLPSLIGALAISPVAGVFIQLIKNLLGLLTKPVGFGIGQFANFVIGCAFILPVYFTYSKNKSLTFFIIGSILGIIDMVLVACLMNYFILIPVYAFVIPLPIDTIVNMTSEANKYVTDFKSLILFGVAPFNLIKGVINAIAGYFLYKLLKPVLSL